MKPIKAEIEQIISKNSRFRKIDDDLRNNVEGLWSRVEPVLGNVSGVTQAELLENYTLLQNALDYGLSGDRCRKCKLPDKWDKETCQTPLLPVITRNYRRKLEQNWVRCSAYQHWAKNNKPTENKKKRKNFWEK